jgi:hypothetical protein
MRVGTPTQTAVYDRSWFIAHPGVGARRMRRQARAKSTRTSEVPSPGPARTEARDGELNSASSVHARRTQVVTELSEYVADVDQVRFCRYCFPPTGDRISGGSGADR